jgi:hypothetical protein
MVRRQAAVARLPVILLSCTILILAGPAGAQDKKTLKTSTKCLKKVDKQLRKALIESLKTDLPPALDTNRLAANRRCARFEPESIGYTGCRSIPGTECEEPDSKTTTGGYLDCIRCSLPDRLVPTPCGNGVVEPEFGEDCDPPGRIGSCPACQRCLADCTCMTTPPTASCPPNSGGGPNLAGFTVRPGADLDTGWVGIGHDQEVVIDAQAFACLDGCNTTTDPECTGTGPTGHGSLNDRLFGPPLPLLAADVATCVVNEWLATGDQPALEIRNLDLRTGEAEMAIALRPIVFLTGNKQRPCPTCTGRSVGETGVCIGGRRAGLRCTTQGRTVRLGNTSSDCLPPAADNAGELVVVLDPVTTGTSTRPATIPCAGGLCPCPGQDKVNNCRGGVGACRSSASCPDPTQPCCQTGDGLNGCFVGDVVRTGTAATAQPLWPDPTYPKLAEGTKLAATFCIPATNSSNINTPVGLPGPGAAILPGNVCVDFLP